MDTTEAWLQLRSERRVCNHRSDTSTQVYFQSEGFLTREVASSAPLFVFFSVKPRTQLHGYGEDLGRGGSREGSPEHTSFGHYKHF
jgi:hypothetical protein